jgi:hypothetical protein
MESLAAILRLLGLEGEASRSGAENPFKDVPDWGGRIAAYAYSIGLAAGVDEEHTMFEPDRRVSAREFTAFLLRALGYREADGDFRFEESLQKAVEVNLYKLMESARLDNDSEYLRAEAVISIADALIARMKDSDSMLIDKLASQGVISKEAAEAFVKSYESSYKRQ